MAENLTRRSFVVAAAASVCAACTAGSFAAEAATAETSKLIDAGPLTDYAKDGVYDAFVKEKKFFIVRENKKLLAITSRCTHKNVGVRWQDKKFVCPQHGSEFDEMGKVTKAPAKASLFRHAITIADGHVMVDKSKVYGEKEWEKSDASASVK